MKKWLRLPAGVMLLLMLSGCFRSPQVRLHTLSALVPERSADVSLSGILVAVGPVQLADYLDHPSLTIRTSPHEISRSDVDRWAGSLGEEVRRATAANLSALLDAERVSVQPWMAVRSPDFRIPVSISRFERDPQGNVVLQSDWALLGPGADDRIAAGNSFVTMPVRGNGGSDTAAAMSAALIEMCRQIAARLAEELKIPAKSGKDRPRELLVGHSCIRERRHAGAGRTSLRIVSHLSSRIV